MNAGGNTNNNVGSYQDNMYSSHNHTGILTGGTIPAPPSEIWPGMFNNRSNDGRNVAFVWNKNPYDRGVSIDANGGNETRPKNANVFYIIKY